MYWNGNRVIWNIFLTRKKMSAKLLNLKKKNQWQNDSECMGTCCQEPVAMSDHLTQTHIIEEITDTPHDTPTHTMAHVFTYTNTHNK